MVTVGSILGDTVRFVRANLPSIAVWGGINLLMSVAMRAIMGPVYLAQSQAIAQGGMPQMAVGPILLGWLVMLVVLVMLYAAVFRAVLFPEESTAFYLRLGWDEARLFGLIALLWLGMMVAMIALSLVAFVIGLVLALVVGQGAVATGAIAIVILLYPLMFFAAVRLSVAGPLTLLRGKIMIGPAWRLTRGKFWTLFGIYVVLFLCMIPLFLIVAWPVFSQTIAAIGHPGDPEAHARLVALQAEQLSLSLTPGHIVTLLVGSLLGAVMLAFFGGAPAMATLQLLDAQNGEG